jgi:transcriptional regulator with XRE-family HTH domain
MQKDTMEKKLLIDARLKKGLTQQQMADLIHMDVSSYNRKEKGTVKVRTDEWQKLAKALAVSVEEIYEPDEAHYFVFKDNSTGNYLGTNHIYSIPEYFLELQRKYIQKLEQEVEMLKNKK